MRKIKIIYYDSITINNSLFEGLVNSVCESVYNVKPGLSIVKYDGPSKDLYEKLHPTFPTQNILILDTSTDNQGYWGYMDNKLWQWLKANE